MLLQVIAIGTLVLARLLEEGGERIHDGVSRARERVMDRLARAKELRGPLPDTALVDGHYVLAEDFVASCELSENDGTYGVLPPIVFESEDRYIERYGWETLLQACSVPVSQREAYEKRHPSSASIVDRTAKWVASSMGRVIGDYPLDRSEIHDLDPGACPELRKAVEEQIRLLGMTIGPRLVDGSAVMCSGSVAGYRIVLFAPSNECERRPSAWFSSNTDSIGMQDDPNKAASLFHELWHMSDYTLSLNRSCFMDEMEAMECFASEEKDSGPTGIVMSAISPLIVNLDGQRTRTYINMREMELRLSGLSGREIDKEKERLFQEAFQSELARSRRCPVESWARFASEASAYLAMASDLQAPITWAKEDEKWDHPDIWHVQKHEGWPPDLYRNTEWSKWSINPTDVAEGMHQRALSAALDLFVGVLVFESVITVASSASYQWGGIEQTGFDQIYGNWNLEAAKRYLDMGWLESELRKAVDAGCIALQEHARDALEIFEQAPDKFDTISMSKELLRRKIPDLLPETGEELSVYKSRSAMSTKHMASLFGVSASTVSKAERSGNELLKGKLWKNMLALHGIE